MSSSSASGASASAQSTSSLGLADILSKSKTWFGGATVAAAVSSVQQDEADLAEFGAQGGFGQDDVMLNFPREERKRVRAKSTGKREEEATADSDDEQPGGASKTFAAAFGGSGGSGAFGKKSSPSSKKPSASSSSSTAFGGGRESELMEEYKLDPNIKLSEDQQRGVNRAVREFKNVFFTGAGGNGKSQALREIIRLCLLFKIKVEVCGATGVAAINLGKLGKTLHSFMGLGLCQGPVKKLLGVLQNKPPAVKQRWRQTQILILDEVSILDPGIFEKFDYLAKAIRGNDLPFGGICLVVCGDFLQLPPVERSTDANFCFQTKAWQNGNIQPILLDKPFRHPDPVFSALLNRMRKATMVAQDWELLAGCLRDPSVDYEQRAKQRLEAAWESLSKLKTPFSMVEDKFTMSPLSLTCRKVDVNESNLAEMERLQPNKKMWVQFSAEKGMADADRDCRSNLENWLANMEKNCPARPDIVMCTGAQVMMCANVDTKLGLVNGQRGIVVGWSTPEKHSRSNRMERYPIVKFVNGKTTVVKRYQWLHESFSYDGTAFYEQVPLMLGWHYTIHKSQSLTVSEVDVDLSTVFEDGQAYVACSRVRTLEGLKLNGLRKSKIKAHADALKFYEDLEAQVVADRQRWAEEAKEGKTAASAGMSASAVSTGAGLGSSSASSSSSARSSGSSSRACQSDEDDDDDM
jgi:ATP-dependent DNA helicase PIF1